MGGDVTGKAVIPLSRTATARLPRSCSAARSGPGCRGAEELEHRIRSNGMYPHVMSRDEVGASPT